MRFAKRHKFLSIVLIVFSIYLYINYVKLIEPNENIDKNSKYYVNDIYMSDQRIYNNYLNEQEKIAYDDMFSNIQKRTSKFEVDLKKYKGMTTADIGNLYMTAHNAILIEHPELLQYSSFSYRYTKNKMIVRINYAIDNKLLEEINTELILRKIEKIKKATKDMSDLEKIKYVYEWIGDNSTYDTLFTYTSKNQSIYNVFIRKNAVCAGFAKTSQVIFQNIGIESMIIRGESTGPHMWNVIKYNDKYYYYDSTYSASINDKNNSRYYDGLVQEELNFYTQKNGNWYPQIETESGLYKKEGE